MRDPRGRVCVAFAFVLALAACAAVGCVSVPASEEIEASLGAEIGQSLARPSGVEIHLPAGVSLDDGVDEHEAVELALANAPDFRALLESLRANAADVAQAQAIPNPELTLLVPVGVKQLEGTLLWAVDALFARPRRVGAAERAFDAALANAAARSLDLVRDARTAHADASATGREADLLGELARAEAQLAALDERRARAGQTDELSAASSSLAAALARERADEALLAARSARARLALLLGLEQLDASLVATPLASLPGDAPRARATERALARRPELRAAKADLEAAGERLGWERRRVLRLAALVDMNEDGRKGFEIGPGLLVTLPLFDQNQAGIARSESEIEQAAWRYAAARRRIALEVDDAWAAHEQASRAHARVVEYVLPLARRGEALARSASQRGVIGHDQAIAALRRRLDAELREVALAAAVRRARAALERSIAGSLDSLADEDASLRAPDSLDAGEE